MLVMWSFVHQRLLLFKGSIKDKILVPKPPKNCARCAKCGHPVNGPYCQGCALLREKLEEDLISYLKYFHDTSESFDDSTNVVNTPREPFVVKKDHGVNPPHIDKCAHIGYNCPPKVLIISNPEPCNQTINNEPLQTLLSFDPSCYFEKQKSVPCVSKPNFVDESSKIFNPPPQPPIYSCKFCGSNAQNGHYCTPQAPFNNPELGYSQDLNFPQNTHNFQQQYLCCDQCGGPHETFQYQQVNFYEPCCENYGGPHENFLCQPVNYCEPNPSYGSYYLGCDQFGDFHPKQYLCCENYGGPHETFQCQPTNEDYCYEQNSCYYSNSFGSDHCQPPQYTVNHPIFNAHNAFLNSQNELFTSQNTIMEQMTQLTLMCEMVCQIFQNKQEEKRIEEEQAAKARYWKIPACCDDDDDYDSAITPILSTEEPIDSLSMGDEHLDTIPASDDVSLYKENIEYVEASPHDSELVSLEAAEIVILEVKEIEDDNLREKFLNVHLLIANIEALKDNPTQSSEILTKSSSTSPKSFLEETNTFHNSFLEFENFYFDLGEISSGSTTTHSNISLPDYEAFYFDDDHVKEISSGNTSTHSDISLSEYDSFIFDFFHEEFADELAHIISPPEYDRFYFWNLPDPGELMYVLNFEIRENLSTTSVNLPIKVDYSSLLAYVVWIFVAYLMYPVIPPYRHPFGNKDTIFDPGITINHFYSFKPGLSHRCGAFKKFNTHRSHLNECPMIINGKNTPILDVLLFHFYPP
nr:hypothetical protein [Tanacetum cinerariifolium]